jgi:hypothetical protein
MFGENSPLGFFGNLRHDPGEAQGPLGVVLARQFGKGRIVIAADRNMLGECFINYADNYRLWLNALAWLLEEDRLRDPAPYERCRTPRLVCYERPADAAFAMPDIQGCYNAWVLLNRYWWTFANERLADPCDLIVFAFNDVDLPADAAAAVAAHLRRGKNVLILNAESFTLEEESGVVGQVLKALAPLQPVRHTRRGKLIFQTPAAGAIHVLGPDKVLDNGKLSPPTRAPNAAEKAQNEALLEAVRDALSTNARRGS